MVYPEGMNSEINESLLPEKERARQAQIRRLKNVWLQRINQHPETAAAEMAKAIVDKDAEIARLQEAVQKLEPLAVLDSLIPDFFRHSYFLQILAEEVETTKKMPQPSSTLITIDLDFLGGFNNKFGHPAGDELLKVVGAAIHQSIRHGDTPGRIGGDELAIIQRRITTEGAVAAARRIQTAVAKTSQEKFAEYGGAGGQTVSIGICLIQPGYSVDLLRKISDDALYAAKKAGRNRIFIGMYDLNTQFTKTIEVAPTVNGGSK